MMQQYFEAKASYPDCVLLFRMGDFYEAFHEDAVTLARELDLTLTARDKQQGEPVPMAGVPHHAVEGYIRRLVERGFHVAVCDQLEPPRPGVKLVPRGVTRVVTPGMLLDGEHLTANANNYLVALAVSSTRRGDVVALAAVDISTGELRVCEVPSQDALHTELRRLQPAEVVVASPQVALLRAAVEGCGALLTEREELALSLARVLKQASSNVLAVRAHAQPRATLGTRELSERVAVLDAHHFRDRSAVDSALALALDYVMRTQGGVPVTLDEPTVYRTDEFVVLDPASAANLELFETLMGGRRSGSLFATIDETVTAVGGRRLRTWLSYPLTDVGAIIHRQSAVTALRARADLRGEIRALLGETTDVQRISSKLAAGQGNARDLVALRQTLDRVPALIDALATFAEGRLGELRRRIDPCSDLAALIGASIVDEPPVALNEGGLIRKGYDVALDRLIELTTEGKAWLLSFEAEQRESTGIPSLKVRHNRVFGYYIEVTRANLDAVPDHYIRKQTLANAERYFTEELKDYEADIETAQERRFALESELFARVRGTVTEELGRLRSVAEHLAELDALAGLAEVAARRDYAAPEVVDEPGIHIDAGRHPVVETMVEGGRFVPNDVRLSDEQRVLLITGPNMAGKSTVIRQVALIALLAQIGSHVPAQSARVGVVDQIFSRVGASDNLARGQSTFMVEMSETAHILRHATERSLVILDEIGRGTSTYDGLSIAWAVAEHLHDELGAFTLFATHYHELTELPRVKPRVSNFNIAAKEWQDDIVFLHKLVEGPANRSYGIQVARLAGVPDEVVARAKDVLANLESSDVEQGDDPRIAQERRDGVPIARRTPQLHLFAEPATPALPGIVGDVASLPLDTMSPIEALNTLYAMQKRARALERKHK